MARKAAFRNLKIKKRKEHVFTHNGRRRGF